VVAPAEKVLFAARELGEMWTGPMGEMWTGPKFCTTNLLQLGFSP